MHDIIWYSFEHMMWKMLSGSNVLVLCQSLLQKITVPAAIMIAMLQSATVSPFQARVLRKA